MSTLDKTLGEMLQESVKREEEMFNLVISLIEFTDSISNVSGYTLCKNEKLYSSYELIDCIQIYKQGYRFIRATTDRSVCKELIDKLNSIFEVLCKRNTK